MLWQGSHRTQDMILGKIRQEKRRKDVSLTFKYILYNGLFLYNDTQFMCMQRYNSVRSYRWCFIFIKIQVVVCLEFLYSSLFTIL